MTERRFGVGILFVIAAKWDLSDCRGLALLLGAEQLASGPPVWIMVKFRPRPHGTYRVLSSGRRSIHQTVSSCHASWVFRGTTTIARRLDGARSEPNSGTAASRRIRADLAIPLGEAARCDGRRGTPGARSTPRPRRGCFVF